MLLASKKSTYFVTTEYTLHDGVDCKGDTVYILGMSLMGERNGLKGCIEYNEMRFDTEEKAYAMYAAMV